MLVLQSIYMSDNFLSFKVLDGKGGGGRGFSVVMTQQLIFKEFNTF